jgi:hypothetical protein
VQLILKKQRLFGIGGDTFAFSEDLAMAAAARFSAVTISSVLILAPHSLQVFYIAWQLFH